jgi:hypothetical protein
MIQPSAGGSALGAAPATETHRILRLLALVVVSLGVVVLAAAAFVLSYSGIHAFALEAGVSPNLARIYPPMLDAILVIAAAAVLSLRGAGWITRAFAWLSLLVVLAAAAAASTLHATNTHLPHRTAATIAAIAPWALALLGFFLLLAMLRHARLRRAQSRRATSAAAVAEQADTIPGAVPSVLGAMTAGAAATQAHQAFGADDDWPAGEFPNGRPEGEVRSPGQAAELAATGYPGDILVAGRPPADDHGAEQAADEPAAGAVAAGAVAAGAVAAGTVAADEPAAGEQAADEAPAGEMATDEPADHRSFPTVPAQALADTEPVDTEPADTEPADTEPGGTVPAAGRPGPSEAGPADEAGSSTSASTSAESSETTAGIPLRRPGGGGADQPETSESSLDSEPGQDDPVSDEAHPASRPGVLWVPRAREEPSAEVIRDDPGQPTEPGTPAAPEASTAAPEVADQGSAQADRGPGGTAPAEPGQAGDAWFTPASGSAAGPAAAEPEQSGDAPAPADQPAKPATSFWDSVFGPRTPEGADEAPGDQAQTQPSGASEEQAEGHPATQPSGAAAADEEPQFDRFRSSPTPPDDE